MQYLLVILAAAAADQLLKYIVLKCIGMMKSVVIIPGFFSLSVIPNEGIALGMMAKHQNVVLVVTSLLMLAIVWYIFRKRKTENPAILTVMSLIIAGGIGNLIDRVRFGYVVDYLDFKIWPYIFNFADACIVVGCFLLLILFWREGRKKQMVKDKPAEQEINDEAVSSDEGKMPQPESTEMLADDVKHVENENIHPDVEEKKETKEA